MRNGRFSLSTRVIIVKLFFILLSFVEGGEDVPDVYLVIFRTFQNVSDHFHTLRRVIDGNSPSNHTTPWYWKLIDRDNEATRSFPSDFSLIQFIRHNEYVHGCSDRKDKFLSVLRKSSEVRNVLPQRRYYQMHSDERDDGICITKHYYNSRYVLEKKGHQRKVTSTVNPTIPELFDAKRLWALGYTGSSVKVAVFDTGLNKNHPHFTNLKERTNWTKDKTLDDAIGHGTFVAGVIASNNENCPGLAPDSELYIFRVFTEEQTTFTSWFLDAFNYAMYLKINVINLSIGGPDFGDRPFVEKIFELSANNVLVVSAIGNDGPKYGTLNNPADQPDVIGVGGLGINGDVASFSSRGMTTWELPYGVGRIKPDIIAFSENVAGSDVSGTCRTMSGTSVASPVVAGAVALLSSVVSEDIRWRVINPALMKQALTHTAERVVSKYDRFNNHIFEQGMGKININAATQFLMNAERSFRRNELSSLPFASASVLPHALDFTDCPYMWPYCSQALYHTGLPTIFNLTILNPLSLSGYVIEPKWKPSSIGDGVLDVSVEFSDVVWPWTGFLAVIISVKEEGSSYSGIAQGELSFTIVSSSKKLRSKIYVPIKVKVIPTPSRVRRILWDQFHNLRYPSAFVPRDNLHDKVQLLDGTADHPHTNFHDLWDHLTAAGYFVEILTTDFTCINATNYGAILLVDPEEEFFEAEIDKLYDDIVKNGISLIVFADWYNVDVMTKCKFFDTNTLSNWMPITGGANIPAINKLLAPFNISLGDGVWTGEDVDIVGGPFDYLSGSHLIRFPAGGYTISLPLREQTRQVLDGTHSSDVENITVLGLVDLPMISSGKLAVFGDSSCLDSTFATIATKNCFEMLSKIFNFVLDNVQPNDLFAIATYHQEGYAADTSFKLPGYHAENEIRKYSKVVSEGSMPGICNRHSQALPLMAELQS